MIVDGGRRSGRSMVRGRGRRRVANVDAVEHGVLEYRRLGGHVMVVLTVRVVRVRIRRRRVRFLGQLVLLSLVV